MFPKRSQQVNQTKYMDHLNGLNEVEQIEELRRVHARMIGCIFSLTKVRSTGMYHWKKRMQALFDKMETVSAAILEAKDEKDAHPEIIVRMHKDRIRLIDEYARETTPVMEALQGGLKNERTEY